MVGKKDGKYVLWPAYFDKKLSRDEGRRIPRKEAVENPTVEGLAKAAQSLGLHPVLEKEAKYPSRQWEAKGRVLVDKTGESKSSVLKKIASRL
ncbi:MAG: signal recognition particle protein Srp19 [Thermoplasmata archaeon]|nr:MAG: signal recognition particle protein Srp19 [Thermoplasmata archaeon]MCD6468825.1 signal recognition particle protein Srp19 [Thermoplasmata archaeon]